MNDTHPTPAPSPSTPQSAAPPSRRRFLRRAAIVTVVAALATVVGARAFAHGGWHRGGPMGGPIDPATLDERLDRMLKHLYVEIDATEAQKQQLAPLVKAAARDLLPLRERLHAARAQAVTLLSQPTIDRGALEVLRADQLRLAEQASTRFVQALADVADVLTPEQRTQLAARMARWHGRRG